MVAQLIRANPYGWVVVGVMFLVLSLSMTARSSLGLVMPTWETEMGWTRTFLSGGSAIQLVVMAIASPIAGLLLDRFGSRPVYVVALGIVTGSIMLTALMDAEWHYIIIYSVFGGFGYAAMSAPMIATTISVYFEEHRGLATGIGSSGATGGQLILMPLLALGISNIGWRPTFVGLGFLVIAVGVLTWILIQRGAGAAVKRDDGGRDETLAEKLVGISKNPTFWLLFGGFVTCGFTTVGAIRVHLLPYAASCGFPPVQSATAYGVLATFSMMGMIGYGAMADRFHRPMLLASIYFLRAFTFILLMYVANDISLLFIFAVIFGVFDFSTFPVVANLVATHVGLRVMGLAMGLLFAGHSIGGAAGAFMGGWLFDLFAQYDWVWIVSVALSLLAAVLTICIPERRGATPIMATNPA